MKIKHFENPGSDCTHLNVAFLISSVIFFIPPTTATTVVRRMACAVYSLCTACSIKVKVSP